MRNALCSAAILAGALLAYPACAQSTAGQLDPSFGTGGITAAARHINFIGNAKQQPDGKIVVAAAIQDAKLATLACGLVRFLPNGQLDPSFGKAGIAEAAPFSNFINDPFDLAIQPDGRIVVAGGGQSADGSLNPAFVTRFTAAGRLDPSFGTNGTTITSFARTDLPQVVLLQPDGKIIVAGLAFPPDDEQPQQVLLARYTRSGALDTTFGAGGRITGLLGTITALALQSDGKILTNNGTPFIRLLPNGTIDTSQAPGTITATAHIGTGTFTPAGAYVLAGTTTEFADRHDIDLQMARFLLDGSPDPSFISPETDFGPEGPHAVSYAPVSVAIQADGSLLAGVPVADSAFRQEFGLARFRSGGDADQAFGTAGQVVTPFPKANGSLLYTLLVQSDGKIVAVGLTLPRSTLGTNQLQLARYLAQ